MCRTLLISHDIHHVVECFLLVPVEVEVALDGGHDHKQVCDSISFPVVM